VLVLIDRALAEPTVSLLEEAERHLLTTGQQQQ